MWVGILISVSLMVVGLWLTIRERSRSALDVMRDVGATYEDTHESEGIRSQSGGGAAGLFPLLAAALVMFARALTSKGDIPGIIIPGILTASIVYLIQKRTEAAKERSRIKEIEYYLPIVMERLVMAVESGLDIVPAIQVIVELETKSSADIDPVTKLFERVIRLTNAGIGFDAALNETAKVIPSPALKHAFIHLGVAFRDGGELIGPLRELSDATQAYFQESVEEEIAKMPVKATMPLVLTFAGLITFFIASPIVQIIEFSSQAVPK